MYDEVKEYYGKRLQSSGDLQTNACTTGAGMPSYLKRALAKVHDEVLIKYYGCGLVLPEALQGLRILDLGSGSGRDCYVLAQLVGEQGSIVGVDMTAEQLAVANSQLEYHREKFGYKKSNVEFKQGYIERLDELDLEDNSFDLIISNCVINLSPDKPAVLKEAYRLLKPGGEMYFSDVYSDRRIPKVLEQDAELYGECLSGALYWNDFNSLSKAAGFLDPRLVDSSVITIDNELMQKKISHINFWSATYRLFKLTELEPACEDYGQAVIYRGGIPEHEEILKLDGHHFIRKGEVFKVCGNTYRMLHETRFNAYFEFIGDFSQHFGIFPACGDMVPFSLSTGEFSAMGESSEGGSCC